MHEEMKKTEIPSSSESQKNAEQNRMKKDKLLFGRCCTC